MSSAVLAADLGGTNIRVARVAADGEVLSIVKERTPPGLSPPQLIDLMRDLARRVTEPAGRPYTIEAVGLAVPAPVSGDFDGVLTKLPNIPTLEGMNIKTAFADVFRVPLAVENDATAAAIGEHWLGASRDVANSLCVTLGTGIGGGIILDGLPLRGPDGTGGEVGHICVEPNGHPCGCGSNGCLEQYASATAVTRLARESGMTVRDSREVYAAFTDGDERARAVFEVMGRYLGRVLAGLVNTLNPDRIVLCGGLAAAWDAFAPDVQQEIKRRAYRAPAMRACVVRCELGDQAGILGVARSAWKSASQNRLRA